jgi:hypothetical protein
MPERQGFSTANTNSSAKPANRDRQFFLLTAAPLDRGLPNAPLFSRETISAE